jgi:hypothetical protein
MLQSLVVDDKAADALAETKTADDKVVAWQMPIPSTTRLLVPNRLPSMLIRLCDAEVIRDRRTMQYVLFVGLYSITGVPYRCLTL